MPSRSRDEFEYEAVAPIHHDGVLAYAVGDTVAAANVEQQGYTEDQVRRRDTDATGLDLVGESGPEPVTPTKATRRASRGDTGATDA